MAGSVGEGLAERGTVLVQSVTYRKGQRVQTVDVVCLSAENTARPELEPGWTWLDFGQAWVAIRLLG